MATTVYCTFMECKHIKYLDENGCGICGKDEITLDDGVDSIMYGCPDAEWDKEVENE